VEAHGKFIEENAPDVKNLDIQARRWPSVVDSRITYLYTIRSDQELPPPWLGKVL